MHILVLEIDAVILINCSNEHIELTISKLFSIAFYSFKRFKCVVIET